MTLSRGIVKKAPVNDVGDKFDEIPLRELMTSLYGRVCGLTLIANIESGRPLEIKMSDGSTLKLSDIQEADRVLREFGWQPGT